MKLLRNGSKDIMSVKRAIKVVPETMKLDTLLNFFTTEKTHSALVVD
jgi:CBS domain containing-hemolysin-like protein